jgi:hypothetical protein
MKLTLKSKKKSIVSTELTIKYLATVIVLPHEYLFDRNSTLGSSRHPLERPPKRPAGLGPFICEKG